MTGSLDIPNPEREKLYYMKLLQTNLPHELYTNNFVAGCSEMFDEFVELLKS